MAAEEVGVEAIFRAAREGDLDIVAGMLDEDPGLLSLVLKGYTLLTTAIRYGRVDLMRLLLERGAEVNQADVLGETALHLAAKMGHKDVVSTLLTSGADLSIKGYRGQTALMIASVGAYVAVVRLLLRSMEDRGLDERDVDGRTALWHACVWRSAGVVQALLLAGADHTIASNIGTTALQIAERRGLHECAALLQVSTSLVSRSQGHFVMALYARSVVPVLYGVAPHNLCLCCSGGRASCSVPMSSTRPGLYTKTPPHASKPLQPQCPPT
jgi:ankyrin repeat protein